MLYIDDLIMKKARAEHEESYYERLTTNGVKAGAGASDVACPRQSYYRKTNPIFSGPVYNYIRMRKGNYIEKFFEDILDFNGISFERQGSYKGEGIFDFLNVHPDLLIEVEQNLHVEQMKELHKQNYKYALIELKSTNAVPKHPHDYWISQVNIQMDTIASTKKCSTDEIHASVYAVELNNGFTMQKEIKYDEELVLETKEQLLFMVEAVQDFIDFKNGEKDHMEFTAHDVPAIVGNLCSICLYSDACFKREQSVPLPLDIVNLAREIAEHNTREKNVKGMRDTVKKFMLATNSKNADNDGVSVTLRGGNKKQVVSVDSFTTKEKMELFKKNEHVLVVDPKILESSMPEEFKEALEKHPKTKVSPISVIIKT